MEGQPSAEKRARVADDEQQDTADLVVLIDMSGSMDPQRNTMIPALERMLRHTLAQTPVEKRDQKNLQVWFFAGDCQKVLSLSFSAISDQPKGLGLVYEPDGPTALYASIEAIIPHCAPGGTLFIATDGENTVESEGGATKESSKRALAIARDERRLRVLALAEGAPAAQEMRALEVEMMQSAAPDNVLSQALEDDHVLLQLSQSLAYE